MSKKELEVPQIVLSPFAKQVSMGDSSRNPLEDQCLQLQLWWHQEEGSLFTANGLVVHFHGGSHNMEMD